MPKASERPGNTLPSKVTKPQKGFAMPKASRAVVRRGIFLVRGRASYLGDPTQGGTQSVENAVPPKKITTPTPL